MRKAVRPSALGQQVEFVVIEFLKNRLLQRAIAIAATTRLLLFRGDHADSGKVVRCRALRGNHPPSYTLAH